MSAHFNSICTINLHADFDRHQMGYATNGLKSVTHVLNALLMSARHMSVLMSASHVSVLMSASHMSMLMSAMYGEMVSAAHLL